MLYVLTKRVGNILSLGLSLQGSSAVPPSSTRRGSSGQKLVDVPPEISLVATAIVVLKLVYGLDGKQRQGPLRANNDLQSDVVLGSLEVQMMPRAHFLRWLNTWRLSRRPITRKVVSTSIGLAPKCLCLSWRLLFVLWC